MQEVEPVEGFRLSPQQRALWNLRREAGSDASLCAVLVEGALDRGRLREALRQIVERHEILRTTFRHVAGIKLPVQVVGECAVPSWHESNLSDLSQAEQDAFVARFIDEETGRNFDCEHGPILRASLLALASDRHVFVLSIFSLCADARTFSNVLEELGAAYATSARDAFEDDEPLQYVQVAEWQNELLEGEEGEEGRGYWLRHGSPEESSHKFSFERTPRGFGKFSSGSYALKINSEKVARITAHAEERGASMEAFFLSCWQILVWRHTGQLDPAVRITLDGRRYAELEPAMGAFARTLPIGCRLLNATLFDSVLAQADESLRDASDWQEYFSPCADEATEKEAGVNSVSCIFEFTGQRAKLHAAGVSFSIFKRLAHTDRFKLKLSCEREGGDVVAEFHYDSELFGARDVEVLAEQFESLLESAVEHAEAPVEELELLNEATRRRLLVEWNETRAEYPDWACVQELFEAQAARTPSGVAVECDGRRLTFAQLNESANRLAHYLRRLEVRPETQVGIVLTRSPEMVVALWAVLKAGGAYVPVEPTYPRERIAFMLAEASVVLTQRSLHGLLSEDAAARAVCLDESFESIAPEPCLNPAKVATPANLAYVLYTSGSTGQPKGVMVTHQGLVNYLSWCTKAYGADEGQGAPVHSPLGFDLTVTSLFAPLLAGRPVVLTSEEQGVESLVEALRGKGGFSLVKLTPAHMQILGRVASVEEVASWARVYVVGGESLFWQDLAFWREHAPAARLINEYGPTETVVGCCVYEVSGDEREDGVVPIGRPIANTEIYLLNEQLRPSPIGVAGELYIGGDGLARGYIGRPDLTAERFIPHPFSASPGERLYRSGDLARYRVDGVIEYLGRTDSQVKIRGYRIELGEIEASLNGQAGVRECAVTVREDTAGDRRLVAYLVGDQGRRPDEGAVRAYLGARLPEYMIPAAFVVLDELPLTANGKIDRSVLPAPGQSTVQRRAYIAPRDLIELRLARAWEDLLGRRGVGARDDFFELGGHSMLAARLVTRISQLFGVQLPLNVLFRKATVEHLAGLIRAKAKPQTSVSPLVQIQTGGTQTPIFFVHPSGGNVFCYLELARHLGLERPVYGFQSREANEALSHAASVEEMASRYVAAMREVQPVGHYHLGGWSMGGVIAFEMARQLEAEGEQVALLALLDSYPTPAQDGRTRHDELELLADFAEDMGLSLDALTITPEELLRRAPHELLPYVFELVRDADILPPGVELGQIRNFYRMFRNNVMAARAYRPGACNTHITLFRAETSHADNSRGHALGWDKLTNAGVEIYDVPGDHFGMVRAPHAEVLAHRLRACLDAATARQAVEHTLVGA